MPAPMIPNVAFPKPLPETRGVRGSLADLDIDDLWRVTKELYNVISAQQVTLHAVLVYAESLEDRITALETP